ncbi:MAG: hypothetical protein QM541_11595 [Flavobacterium sp.]|nr:hypothetical protein [Flavobacterium sp.]
MQLLKSLTITCAFLVSHLTVLSQNFNYNSSIFKKVVRIGIYVSPKANFHTRVITDIGHFYANTKTAYEREIITAEKDTTNNKSQHIARANYQKLRYDSADAFDRLFSSAANFISVEFNSAKSSNQNVNTDDTLILPLVKVESLENINFSNVIQRDTLDCLIYVSNFNTIEVKPYYELEFTISISPTDKQKKASIKSMRIPFINQPRKDDIFFQGSTPFECLAANTIHDFLVVVTDKLYKDGYH